jgi:hypothetical protein
VWRSTFRECIFTGFSGIPDRMEEWKECKISMTSEHKNSGTGINTNLVWMGVGVGAAIGVAVALNRRKRSGWYMATRRVADKTNDLAGVSRDMLERIKVIYDETRKVVDEATELWSQGRKLVGV